MPIDLQTSTYLLSIVASTAKLIEFGLNLKGRVPRKDAEAIVAAATANASQAQPSPEMVAMVSNIGGPIREAITKRIADIQERIINIVSDGTLDPVQRRQMLNNDQRAFCEELHLLKKWNGGQLPPDLQREWDLSNCGQFKFY